MLRTFIILLLLATGAAGATSIEPGQPAPPWQGIDHNGNQVKFPAVLDGKPAVVVFWATWCPYCVAFMPYLGEILEDYGTDNISVVAINHKERGHGDPAAYVADLGFPVIDVADGDPIGDDYGVAFIPGLMIVDGSGTLVWKRESTDLPAGKTVAELWDGQVREQLAYILSGYSTTFCGT